ncbi:MAG TPA: hypothetical protein VHA75_06570 [Rugosimonospora sp.]|nr:hypothetical protein [Rugosimonospora sp.]
MIRRALAWLAGRGELACAPYDEDGPDPDCDCEDCEAERVSVAWHAELGGLAGGAA